MSNPEPESPLKRTPLYESHVALGARICPFGGFAMPVQYTGIVEEHHATRRAATIFDTCHMGEFRIEGPRALADLENLVSCDIAPLEAGQCRYGMLCDDQGGTIDDLLVYRRGAAAFMLVVNAGTQQADFDWIAAHLSPGTTAVNESEATAKLDLQGPGSPRLMTKLLDAPIADLRFYRFTPNRFGRAEVLVSRTGYTGEIGFEIYADPDTAIRFWQACLEQGALPAGLGARDTLRLEMGMPLYGHELSRERNAAEAGFAMAIATAKPFIGADALRDPSRRAQRLVGIALADRRAAREGDAVRRPGGEAVGRVTSGSFAPSLGHAVALAYVAAGQAAADTAVEIATARQPLPGRIVPLPFYRDATARRPMREFLNGD